MNANLLKAVVAVTAATAGVIAAVAACRPTSGERDEHLSAAMETLEEAQGALNDARDEMAVEMQAASADETTDVPGVVGTADVPGVDEGEVTV